MSYIFEQKFYRVGTSVRNHPKQEVIVQVEIDDPTMHPQLRRSMAKRALLTQENTGFKSGWTSWQFGKSTIVAKETAQIVEVNSKQTMTHEDAVVALKPFARFKIKNVYEKGDFPVDAVTVLQPGFEYADWEEDRVSTLWRQ